MAEFIHNDPKTVQLNDMLFSVFKHFLDHGADVPYPLACPEHGAFIGYKIGFTYSFDYIAVIPCIITLAIPEDAKRSSAASNKCRCDKAKVLDITTLGGRKVNVALSYYDNSFIYEVNKEVSVLDFDEDRWHECAPGIHFFMSEKEALEYWG